MPTKTQIRCGDCQRPFTSERGLAIHACKTHDDCAERTLDRHVDRPRYTISLPSDDKLGRACKAEADRRGVSMAELARLALTRMVRP